MLDYRILSLFALPVLAALVTFLGRGRRWNLGVALVTSTLFLLLSLWLAVTPGSLTAYFRVDALGGVFLVVMAILFLAIAVAGISFFSHKQGRWFEQTYYTVSLLLFVPAMAGVILSTHAALLWVFVELTTLTSAYLIYFHRTRHSLEAAWKYIFICSIGISLAFVGVILLSLAVGQHDSLFFDDLYARAKELDPFWLKLAFVFVVVGYGTKAGLAPVHAWLPDAHAEAPSPISALLSGALLNTALLGILRMNRLMRVADLEYYSKNLLLVMGFLSILVSATYVLRVRNYKRMLAYSSVENMGIVVLGAALGKPGLVACLLHVVSHSLGKASFFLTAGAILHRTGTKKIADVRGLASVDPLVAGLWIVSFAAIAGFPPFPAFQSEFLIAKGFFDAGYYIPLALLLVLLTVVVYGMGKAVFDMSFGVPADGSLEKAPSTWAAWLPQVVLLALLVVLGLGLWPAIGDHLKLAAEGL